LDRIDASFDDPNLVANAGLLLVATLSQRLDLEAMIEATVRLTGRVGGARPGRKTLTLVHALCAGGSHIDHTDMLRAGATAGVLGHRLMAPRRSGRSCARSASGIAARRKPWSATRCNERGPPGPGPATDRW
jgi:hypothetical protein